MRLEPEIQKMKALAVHIEGDILRPTGARHCFWLTSQASSLKS
jgi:hypothetical protein